MGQEIIVSVPLRGEGTKAFHGFPHRDGITAIRLSFTHCFTLSSTLNQLLFKSFTRFLFIWSLPGFRITEMENIRNRGAGEINNLESSVQMQLVPCWNGNIQALFPKEAISTF